MKKEGIKTFIKRMSIFNYFSICYSKRYSRYLVLKRIFFLNFYINDTFFMIYMRVRTCVCYLFFAINSLLLLRSIWKSEARIKALAATMILLYT